MADFTLKQNDRQPSIRATLKGADGNAKDLSSSSEVRFKMGTSSGTLKINEVITPIDAVNGVCLYEWGDEDTDTAGTFFAEFEVLDENGLKETFPNDKPLTITIKADKL